ncbi:MAG: hypothetical protein AB7O37_11985 [Vicinamibacteria bacterium]
MHVETEDGHEVPPDAFGCLGQAGDGRLRSARVEDGQRASLLFELSNGSSLLAIRPFVPVALMARAAPESRVTPARFYVRLGDGPDARWVPARVVVTPGS